MGIETIFANVSCSSLETSLPWYQKLFGTPPTRRPMDGLVEWHFTDSAAVQAKVAHGALPATAATKKALNTAVMTTVV